LKSTGKGAIILPHGVLFRGNKEADIRRELVRRGYIKGIIGLPPNLFYGTGIPACIIVIDKENAHARKGIFMIDASKGFMKDGNKNRLREQDIRKIVDVFTHQIELPRYSRMVPISEIADPKNDYNLNIPRYIDSSEPEDMHDLNAHLNGGIPNRDIDALGAYWKIFPTLRDELFQENGRPGYSDPRVEAQQVKQTIVDHPEFSTYADSVKDIFVVWRDAHKPLLMSIGVGSNPKQIISTISEDLLQRFEDIPLLDKYDVYQRLMDYWNETMQDDLYLIVSEGWRDAAQPRAVIEDKERKIKESPDLTIGRKKYKMDLLPPVLIIARYFTAEESNLQELQVKADEATQALEAFIEERTGDEGVLEDATNDNGKVTKGAVKQRLRELGSDPELADERKVLEQCLQLIELESAAKKAVKDTQAKLNKKVMAKYAELTEEEIKTLVVEDKWFASIGAAVESEVQRVTQRLAARIKELQERYAEPLPQIEQEVEECAAKVEDHLKRMGVQWG
ncbi:MAG: N-6 DNA methylase, partial [Deltaproteobacteria bacterium]|nr:N-6 DNA methylase [Deltaproteobacteria bacterium]